MLKRAVFDQKHSKNMFFVINQG